MKGYHGSFWALPDAGEDWDDVLFTSPDASYNDDGLVYYSNSLAVAEKFTTWRHAGEPAVFFVVKGELSITNPYYYRGEHEIELNGITHDFSDRSELVTLLRNCTSYDAIITPGNYPCGGDDIAVLDDSKFAPESIMFKEDDTWSEWYNIENLVQALRERCPGKRNPSPGM